MTMVMRNREKVAGRGVAEPCGGGAVAAGRVWDDGAPSLEAEADAGGEAEGASAGAVSGATEEVEGASDGGGDDGDEGLVTLMFSFWPLLQWPEKLHEK
ncbi:hypothetical protein Fmac_012840 [Flemingia macrophylla]|uniref:Uncharacterized protein n=1 Tax=Flemingia macrophylla TaxID=520843 RepID=A0ABD1MRH0_9FABA